MSLNQSYELEQAIKLLQVCIDLKIKISVEEAIEKCENQTLINALRDSVKAAGKTDLFQKVDFKNVEDLLRDVTEFAGNEIESNGLSYVTLVLVEILRGVGEK